ncbi:invertase [Caballeronia calidae]|uniref:Invertase n=1 Tax=Caballeronia calidae TaxID=1777139 RepID=A0A158EKT4_9BURK|nr:invertase [Caballeronia calidae]
MKNGQRVGYVRVSTFEQNAGRQLDGVDLDRIFTDKASGKDVKRPQLDALLGFVRAGDTVVIHSMDRLARNLDDLRHIVQSLTERGVSIEFTKECLTFTGEDSPMANLMLSVMGAFADDAERGIMQSHTAIVAAQLASQQHTAVHYPGSNNEAISASGALNRLNVVTSAEARFHQLGPMVLNPHAAIRPVVGPRLRSVSLLQLNQLIRYTK